VSDIHLGCRFRGPDRAGSADQTGSKKGEAESSHSGIEGIHRDFLQK
jgi:hypothetical protein